MGIKASALRAQTKRITILIENLGDLNIDIRPGVYTQAFQERLNGINERCDEILEQIEAATDKMAKKELLSQAKAEIFAEHDKSLSDIFAGWDYLGEDDKPLPINSETFRNEVPDFLLEQIWAKVREAQQVPKANPRP